MYLLTKSLAPYFKTYKGILISGVFFVVLSSLIKSFQGVVIRILTDGLTESVHFVSFSFLLKYLSLFLLLSVSSGYFMYLMRQKIIVMSRYMEYDQKNDIFFHFLQLPSGFFQINRMGDLMNRIGEDVGKVRMFTGPAIMYITQTIVTLVTVLFFMINSSPILSFYVLLPLPFLSLFIYFITRQIHHYALLAQENLSGITSTVQESMNGIRTIRSAAKKEIFLQKLHQQGLEYRRSNLQLSKRDALFGPVVTFLISLTIILTVWKGSQLVNDHRITRGTITEFIFYLYQLTWPFTSIGWVSSLIQRAAASQKRINEMLHVSPESGTGNKIPESMNIEMKNIFVKIQFREILHEINFHVPEHTMVGLTGKTGSGKSTLLHLLEGKVSPVSGKILVGNIPLEEIDKNRWMEQVSFVSQEPFLFSESIRNNILFGCKNSIQDEELFSVTRLCQIHDEILSFPEGYNTKVGERGINLSGGQKQRICLARALIRRPRLLVLDDCLSALDLMTAQKIIREFFTLKEKCTILMVSSRLSDLTGCDVIYFMEKGTLSAQGTHAELLKNNSGYKKMWDLQKNYPDFMKFNTFVKH